MKKLFLISALALLVSCSSESPFAEGKKAGEIYVTASSGARTVLVKLSGLWKVSTDQDWMSLDVNGRDGEGAFTFYYSSNESDMVSANATRKGKVIIEDLSRMVADTLYILQQGTPDGHEYESAAQDSYIEFIDTPLTRIKAVYANLQGVDDVRSAANWVESSDADVLCLIWDEDKISGLAASYPEDAEVYRNVMILDRTGMTASVNTTDVPVSLTMNIDGICFTAADFDADLAVGMSRYTQMQKLLSSGFNKPGMGSRWIIGGSFYFYSVMETGCSDTPSWYPGNPFDPSFDADRYAQTNNLIDCVWMCNRHFTPTYSDVAGSWRADYVYASNSVWNAAVTVEVGDEPLTGAVHRTIGITVKY